MCIGSRSNFLLAAFMLLPLFAGCGRPATDANLLAESKPAKLEVTSSALAPGGAIDAQYTFDGENVSPPLAWSGAPAGTQSYVIFMERPVEGEEVGVHWVLYDLPADVTKLDAGVPRGKALPNGAKQGTNHFQEV